MPNEKRELTEYQLYHITTRGNKKNIVLIEDEDYLAFLRLLRKAKDKYKNIRLYAYCLMPNHYHLLINSYKADEISKFMHKINLSYSIFFNKKYSYVGHIWQKRYFPKPIFYSDYIEKCIYYIENNPVRAELCNDPSEYKWSSCNERLSSSQHGILDYFSDLV